MRAVPVLVLLFMTTVLHQIGSGILLALIPLRIAIEGLPASVAGIISSAFSVGFIVGCLIAPAIITRLGVTRAIISFTAVNATAAALLWAFPSPVVWGLSRLLAGGAVASFFVVIEAWLAASATIANRGRVLGVYMVMNRLAFMVAQALFVWIDPRADALFAVVVVVYLLSSMPQTAARETAPPIPRKNLAGLLDLPRHVPAAAAGILGHGLMTAVGPALLPSFGVSVGLTSAQNAMALVALQLGGLCLQMPVALLGDRYGRRQVMACAAGGTAVLSLLILVLSNAGVGLPLLLVLLALWAGLPTSTYSLAAAHANDRTTDAERVTLSSALLLMWGIGAAAGPLIASLAMDWLGAGSLFGFTAIVGVLLAAFLAWRGTVRPG